MTTNEFPEVTTALEDDTALVNASSKSRKITFKNILEAISFTSLTTTAKNIIGAINELKSGHDITNTNVTNNANSISELNTNLNFKSMANITYGTNWSGDLKIGKIAPHIGIIYGYVTHTVAKTPTWGETIAILTYNEKPSNNYYIPLHTFDNGGSVIDSVVYLPDNGLVRAYPPGNASMNVVDRRYDIWGVFYC